MRTRTSSSPGSSKDVKRRFVEYFKYFVEAQPEPELMPVAEGNSVAQLKTAFTRNQRYNDPKLRQNLNPKGASNAK